MVNAEAKKCLRQSDNREQFHFGNKDAAPGYMLSNYWAAKRPSL